LCYNTRDWTICKEKRGIWLTILDDEKCKRMMLASGKGLHVVSYNEEGRKECVKEKEGRSGLTTDPLP
jgi:hypothetical protein